MKNRKGLIVVIVGLLVYGFLIKISYDKYLIKEVSMLVPLLVSFVFFVVFSILTFLKSKKSLNFLTLSISVLLSLVLLEFLLSKMGKYQNYFERNGGKYRSVWKPADAESHYHIWSPNNDLQSERIEFNYKKRTNSLGFVTDEYPLSKDSNEFRIIVLGDSFTEGIGAPLDSVFPKQLETLLGQDIPGLRVLNAGVSGSDPIFNYRILKDKLFKYEPDVLIFMLNDSDTRTDIPIRGGFERFLPDGTIKFNSPPINENLYATSFLARMYYTFLGYEKDLFPTSQEKRYLFYLESVRVLNEFQDSLNLNFRSRGIPSYLMYHPVDSNFKFTKFDDGFIKDLEKSGLEFYPLRYRMGVINEDNLYDYYWPLDRHHNSKGYGILAKAVRDVLLEEGVGNKKDLSNEE